MLKKDNVEENAEGNSAQPGEGKWLLISLTQTAQ
jgi:hypothetical protein